MTTEVKTPTFCSACHSPDESVGQPSLSAEEIAELQAQMAKTEIIALKIAEDGDPIRLLVNQTQKYHKGDKDAIKILLASIASTNSATSEGIQPGINGKFGRGKSDAAIAVLNLVPDQYKVVSDLTAQAVWYMDIKPGTIISSDDVDWTGGLLGTMKRSMGEFQKPHNKQNVSGDRKTLSQVMPERLAWWTTCVESVAHDQLKDRLHSLDIDEEFGHAVVVSKYTGSRRAKKQIRYAVDLGSEVGRWIIYDIKNHPIFKVVIDCADDVDWKLKEDHRMQNKFFDLVEAFAILRWRQRTIDSDGWLHATVEDFNMAKEIMEKKSKNHRTHLTDPQINVVHSIIKLQRGQVGVTQAMIAEDIVRSQPVVSSSLKAIMANTNFVVEENGRYRCPVEEFDYLYSGGLVSLPDDYKDPVVV